MRKLLGYLFVAALLVFSGKATLAQDVTISIAGPAVDTGGEMFYAADMGFFKKAGLNVKITTLNSTGTLSAAVASGAIDIGSLTVPSIAVARDKSIPLVVAAPAGLYDSSLHTSGLIVLKSSPIHNAADLNGKTIETRDLTNLSAYGAKIWMDKNGGDSSTVRFVELPDSEASAALRAGRVDAASITSPELGIALSGDDRLVAPIYDAIAPRFLVGVYFTSETFAKAHPDLVRKFYDVIVQTARWANTHHQETAAILAKYRGGPLKPGPRVIYADGFRSNEIQPLLDLLYKYGTLKKPVRANSLIVPGLPML